jgi:hypothetical protein
LNVWPQTLDADVVEVQIGNYAEVFADRLLIPIQPAVPPVLSWYIIDPKSHWSYGMRLLACVGRERRNKARGGYTRSRPQKVSPRSTTHDVYALCERSPFE